MRIGNMNKTILFAAFAVAATLCACTSEPLDDNTDPEVNTGKEVMVTIKASLEDCSDSETKTYLSGTELKQYDTPLWKTGDSFKLMSNMGGSWDFTLNDGSGSTQGSFSCSKSVSSSSLNFCALYPNTLGNIERNGAAAAEEYRYTYSFDLPSEQTGSVNDASGQMPAFAYVYRSNTTDAPVFDNVKFYNICGLFRIALTSASPVKVGKLEIIDKDEDANLWGKAYIHYSSTARDYNDWRFQLLNSAAGHDTLIVNYSPAVSLSSSDTTYFYAAVPPGSLSSGVTVNVYDDSDNIIGSFSKNGSLTVARAHIKPMKAKDLIYTSLSDEETANCYIVDAAGLYKYPALQGNSDTSVGEVAEVEVLWESDGTTTAPAVGSIVSSVGFKDKNVHFSTTGKAGNAVIAVKDSEDNILWSWHIWIPSSTIETSKYTGKSIAVMDRNLGALVAEENNILSNGLTYQWGRKDPFPGSASYSSNTQAATTCTFTSDATTAEKGTESYVIQNPTEYLKQSSPNNNYADWVFEKNKTHWGSTKTVWDPCPVGYKVAHSSIWSGLSFEIGTYGFILDSKHWYPLTGYRYSSDGAIHETGTKGFYWASNAGDNQASYLKYDPTNEDEAKRYTTSSMARSAGLAVRCVKVE